MNTSCNCRCSFKNRSTLIIVRLFKVFAFYFSKKKIVSEAKRQGGEKVKSRLVKKGCHGILYCTTGGQGEFHPIILQVQEALHCSPLGCSQQVYCYSPVIFTSNTAKDAITLVYNSWSLLWNSGCRQNWFFGGEKMVRGPTALLKLLDKFCQMLHFRRPLCLSEFSFLL